MNLRGACKSKWVGRETETRQVPAAWGSTSGTVPSTPTLGTAPPLKALQCLDPNGFEPSSTTLLHTNLSHLASLNKLFLLLPLLSVALSEMSSVFLP